MRDLNLLSGGLIKRSLPVLSPGPGVPLPSLKRLVLSQGELAQFHDGDPGIRYIASLEMLSGSVRGNHYHRIKEEHFYLMRGGVELIAEGVESKERVSILLEAGDLAVLRIGVAHAYCVREPGVAIEFSPTPFDSQDVYPHPLAG
jgi:hypothetical protein